MDDTEETPEEQHDSGLGDLSSCLTYWKRNFDVQAIILCYGRRFFYFETINIFFTSFSIYFPIVCTTGFTVVRKMSLLLFKFSMIQVLAPGRPQEKCPCGG